MQPASLLQPGAMPAMQPPMGGAPDSPMLGQRSVDRLLENPWFLLGSSILAADNSPVGQGLLAASQAAGKRRDPQYDMKLRQVQYLMQQGIPREQAIAMVFTGGASLSPEAEKRLPKYSVNPQYEQDAEGNTFAVQYADDGTRREIPLERKPFSVESRTPEYRRDVAQAESAGRAAGQVEGLGEANFAKNADKARRAVQLVRDMIAHPGRKAATGTSSMIPSLPGGNAKDYEKKFEQLMGVTFLEAYETLKGGGQITQIEGERAMKAKSDLDLAQSEEAHLAALNELLDAFQTGFEILAERQGQPIPEGFWDDPKRGGVAAGGATTYPYRLPQPGEVIDLGNGIKLERE